MIFTHKDNEVVGFGNPPLVSEIKGLVDIPLVYGKLPNHYKMVNGKILPKTAEELVPVALAQAREALAQSVKAQCERHIFASYPAPVQQSMALDVYPTEEKEIMVEFIADCIEEKNEICDEILEAETMEALGSLSPVWPEVLTLENTHKFDRVKFNAKKAARAELKKTHIIPTTLAKLLERVYNIESVFGIKSIKTEV